MPRTRIKGRPWSRQPILPRIRLGRRSVRVIAAKILAKLSHVDEQRFTLISKLCRETEVRYSRTAHSGVRRLGGAFSSMDAIRISKSKAASSHRTPKARLATNPLVLVAGSCAVNFFLFILVVAPKSEA